MSDETTKLTKVERSTGRLREMRFRGVSELYGDRVLQREIEVQYVDDSGRVLKTKVEWEPVPVVYE